LDLAIACETVARAYEQHDQLATAVEQQEQALKLITTLAQKDAANARVQKRLAHIQVRYAELTGRAKRFDEARRAYDESIATYAKVLEFTPDDIGARRMRVYAIASLGNMLGEQKQYREAAAYHRKAIEALEPMLAATPNDVAIAGGMAYSCAYAGQYLLKTGDAIGAVPLLRRGVELNEQVVAADPANAMLGGNLADTRIMLGDALRALGSLDQARDEYLKAKAILLPLFNQNRLSNGRKLIDRVEARLAHLDDPTAATGPATQPDSED
jgi:tetratricopeptide (TPR) repeat protein